MGDKEQSIGGGAWGFGPFQSNWDYDHLQDLSWEAGLLQLEEEDAEKQGKKAAYSELVMKEIRKEGTEGEMRENEHAHADLPKKKDDEVYYNIYAGLCSSPKRVRQWLEKTAGRPGNTSILQHMITRHMALAVATRDKPRIVEYSRPGYNCVLLGAALMTMGCKLPDNFLQHLRANYEHYDSVGLMRDARQQMRKALGPDGYKNDGTPYDFGSKGLKLTLSTGWAPLADRCVPWMPNVHSPAGEGAFAVLQERLRKSTADAYTVGRDKNKKRPEASSVLKKYGPDVCGGCGAKDGVNGKVLVKCSKCKGRLYCGKDCQKSEWAKHKLVCKAVLV
ncbi:hypothetical protein LTR15_005818 [Elasticomyces elasticus]|nr:hypothetical protein LTR15_005818 [Elasticomyces elasticus]